MGGTEPTTQSEWKLDEGAPHAAAPGFASIAVGRPVRGEFTYRIPAELSAQLVPGHRVLVPFGRGQALAFYLGPALQPSAELERKLRPVSKLLDTEPALPADLIELLRFSAEHYRYPLGEAIRGALPPGLSTAQDDRAIEPDVVVFASVTPAARLESLVRAPSQHAVLSYLLAVGGRASLEELHHAIPGSRDPLKRLVEKGWALLDSVRVEATVQEGLGSGRPEKLTVHQASAVAVLEEALGSNTFAPYLLHGVTGSGKTEVYLRVVERALALGRGALVLVPEIALTPQLVGRFRSRFGPGVAVLHSALKDRERLRHWQRLRRGEALLAVGVRSAVFAPVQALGVVVVDEEHDPSFKQEDKLRYQARDLAVVRAKQAGALVVLGSATPSLETLENVRRGRYQVLSLPVRVDDRPMPTVSLVDLRELRPREQLALGEEPPILSAPLIDAMQETLDRGQQTILFLNRRGHSTFLVCEVCGQNVRCRDCDVCLTHHKSLGRLVCHYCGMQSPVPGQCLDCKGPLLMLGIGTERVEAEVASRFSRARVARLDRDSASTSEKLTDLLAAFARREIDILVGTQMVAKGHDFPGVTLVCVVMADTSLSMPDFRAAERTVHLLTQVGGRAGRGKDPGRVLIQTYNPDSPSIHAVLTHDFEGFSQRELQRRKALAYPPYTRMAAIRLEGADPDVTTRAAKLLGQRMASRLPPAQVGVRLLGPAPAPIARIKNKWRWQLLLKGPSHASIAGPLAAAEAALDELPASVRVVIDVDPGAML